MSGRPPRAVLDTSVLIARESGRPLAVDRLPLVSVISVVSLAELRAGVLAAQNTVDLDRRVETLESVANVELLLVDEEAARQWAMLRIGLLQCGRRAPANDLWIAATALAHGLPVVTQDADFDALDGISSLQVIRV